MAWPYATSALIRYVTDKVLENVAKQMARPSIGPEVATLPAASPDLAAVIGSLNSGLLQLQGELTDLEQRLERLDRRMTRLEKRWGWAALARIVVAVAVAFVFGFAAALLFRLGGWMH